MVSNGRVSQGRKIEKWGIAKNAFWSLAPSALKVWLSLVFWGDGPMTEEELVSRAHVSRGTVSRSLGELRTQQLLRYHRVPDEGGHSAGLVIELLVPPPSLPDTAKTYYEERLARRQAGIDEERAMLERRANNQRL